jgi:adenylate kinase family enzyme
MKIHVLGSSGSGTTTLGSALADHFGCLHFDSDDYYWKKTTIPYSEINEITERQRLLLVDISVVDSWILSGSMDSWSDPFISKFDLVIFLEANAPLREQRLRGREANKFGDRILPGGDMHEHHEYFIKWAIQYDEGLLGGRSRVRHEKWLLKLKCPVVRFINEQNQEALLNRAVESIDRFLK